MLYYTYVYCYNITAQCACVVHVMTTIDLESEKPVAVAMLTYS